ncbi:hypothetical protein [Streptomyces sp. NPDC006368]|uniref:hypothetical protein n=1 Tax=Streptomyces sp. NPDC006368 TaxID=3156760 RepID=UPI0033BE6CB5
MGRPPPPGLRADLRGRGRGEYGIGCPVCRSELFVAFHEEEAFASAGDHVTADPPRAPLLPADPERLDGIAPRLSGMARAAGRDGPARGLTYLFGEATCPDCGTVFPVSARVAERPY